VVTIVEIGCSKWYGLMGRVKAIKTEGDFEITRRMIVRKDIYTRVGQI